MMKKYLQYPHEDDKKIKRNSNYQFIPCKDDTTSWFFLYKMTNIIYCENATFKKINDYII